jgi:hypothetical protein
MTIRYKCEECGAALNINDELAGTDGSCPRCHVEFVVPSPEAAAKPAKAKPAASGSLSTEDEIGDFLAADDSPPRRKPADDETEADSSTNPFDDDAPRQKRKPVVDDTESDEGLEVGKKKKGAGKSAGGGGKASSGGAADIARNLMGKGERPESSDEITKPDDKKKRRKFGDASDRPQGEISSAKELITYLAKVGWPFVLGGGVVIGLLTWWMFSRMKSMDLPPLADVSGKVMLDGKPVTGATVMFTPLEASKNLKLSASIGYTGEGGVYSLTYAGGARGAVIGKHRVVISPLDPSQRIPFRYSDSSSTLTADVGTDGKPVDFDLKSDPVPTE